jgi:hypothetical protein
MLLRVFVLLTLLVAFAAPARAEVTRPMSSHPSSSQLASACGAAGGDFVDNTDVDPNGGYQCTKSNCDGQGGKCTVSCGTKGCAGTTPSRIVKPMTLIGLLQNGNEVIRDPIVTGGTDSLSDPSSAGPASAAAATPPPPPSFY